MSDPVSRVRRFNRAVTSEVGALDTSFLGRGRPLGAARVLNAIGHGRGDVAELRDYLGLDSGLMSRLLRSLEDEELIATMPHPDDARRRIAKLTRAGQREYSAYEAISNSQAEVLLARHSQPDLLLAAMDAAGSASRKSIRGARTRAIALANTTANSRAVSKAASTSRCRAIPTPPT
jgi:DNA-binding MarR family transcriptional regulator